MIEFTITDPYIELYKLLKAADLVDSGAEAKALIAQGHVYRNAEIELRKRAKILPNEEIRVAQATIKVIKKES